jgi:hypothetical protein
MRNLASALFTALLIGGILVVLAVISRAKGEEPPPRLRRL